MRLTYEPKIRVTLVEPSGIEGTHFLRGNLTIGEVLANFGYSRARYKGELLGGKEALKELAAEDGSLTLKVR